MPADGVNKKDVRKVVLAYSGGLDTSIILKWLQTTYGCEVVTFTADLGQGDELEPARQKALNLGIKPQNIFIEDLREEFVRDYVFPMFRANALYEGQYLLGTSIARPLIAIAEIDVTARKSHRRVKTISDFPFMNMKLESPSERPSCWRVMRWHRFAPEEKTRRMKK